MNTRTQEDRARYIREMAYQVQIGHCTPQYAQESLEMYDAFYTIEKPRATLRRPNPHINNDTFKKPEQVKLYPKQIFAKLDKNVIGQHEAKKLLSSIFAVYISEANASKYCITAPRIALIGPTGSGKTHTLQSFNDTGLLNFIFLNSARYTGAGCEGEQLIKNVFQSTKSELHKKLQSYLENILHKHPADEVSVVKELSKTVLVFDEFDKIAQGNSEGWAEMKMSAFMTVIDGIDITLTSISTGLEFTINTKYMPMVFLGAFSGLEEYEQTTPMVGIGFESKTNNEKVLLKSALASYGFMPEVLGRITSIVKLNKLTKEEYIQVLESNILPRFVKQFQLYDVAVMFDSDFKEYIAEQAEKTGEGARSLFELVEKEIRDKLFDLEPKQKENIVMKRTG